MRCSPSPRLTPGVAVVLALVGAAGAAAEDDFPVKGRGPAAANAGRRARAAVPADEPAEPAGPFVLMLANGDRLTGRLVGLDARRLQFRPDATGDVDFEVPLAKIEGLERSVPDEPVEPRGDRVHPVVGGVIHGPLTGIDARRIVIDAHLVGPLELDLESVAAFVRNGAKQPERTAADAMHEVHEAAGSRLVGQVAFGPTGVKVASPGLTAEVALREVTAILFPVVEPAGASASERPATCTLELMNGSEIVGTAPRLDAGRIVVGLGGERTAAVPLDHVARAGFGGAAAGGSRRVLLWTRCADQEEEAVHMAEALEAGLPAGWKVVVDAETSDADRLAAAVKPAGVLVVAEMEHFDADELPEPDELGRVLRAFLARGGTVVLAGVSGESQGYWKEAGIVSLTSWSRVDDVEFEVVRGHPLGRGVGDSFTAVNGTEEYETDDAAMQPVAARDGGGAAVLVKKAGRGTVVLLGMDYYKRSEAIDRLLVNAATQGRGQR
jgi:hypothetical protein